MKYLLITLVMLVCSVFIMTQVNATVLFQDDFNSYSKDWLCKLADCSINPGLPVKAGQSKSDYLVFNSNVSDWNGTTPSYNSGITSDAGMTGRGFRYYLRQEPFPNGENLLVSNSIGSYNPIYLRWYEKDSHLDFSKSSYQKLFRLYHNGSTQTAIPEWIGGYGSGKTYMRLWLGNGATMVWTNYNLATSGNMDKWVCYEMKLDIVNNKYEFFVNGVSMGEKSASSKLNTSYRVKYIGIGGNQHNTDCWTPKTALKTRDMDNVVVSTTYIGPITTVPSEITPYNETWYPEAKTWCDLNEWEIVKP